MLDQDYFAHPAISQSDLKKVLKSPAHFLSYKNGPKQAPTPQMQFGTAFHTYILEPKEIETRLCFTDLNKRTKAFEEFEKSNPSKIILSMDDKKTLEEMQYSINSNSEVMSLLSDSKKEQVFMWNDTKGLQLKAKMDAINHNTIIDIKTTKSAKDTDFVKSIFSDDYAYYFQAAFYTMGLKAVTGKDYKFKFVAIEKEAPYGIGIFELSANALFKSQMVVRECLDVLSLCVQENKYPSYNSKTFEVDWPRWK